MREFLVGQPFGLYYIFLVIHLIGAVLYLGFSSAIVVRTRALLSDGVLEEKEMIEFAPLGKWLERGVGLIIIAGFGMVLVQWLALRGENVSFLYESSRVWVKFAVAAALGVHAGKVLNGSARERLSKFFGKSLVSEDGRSMVKWYLQQYHTHALLAFLPLVLGGLRGVSQYSMPVLLVGVVVVVIVAYFVAGMLADRFVAEHLMDKK